MLDHPVRHIAFLDATIATYDRNITALTAADAEAPGLIVGLDWHAGCL
jgi:hypothetical protein